MKKIGYKVAILGLGSIGTRHLQNIVNEIKGVDEIFVYDTNQEKTGKLLNDSRIKSCGKEELLDKRPDIVFICTPNGTHYEDSVEFVKAGIPVFIEKPVTVKFSECNELAKASSAPVIAGCNMRYHPAIKKAKEIIQDKSIGDIIYARAYFGHSLKNWRPGSDYKKSYSAREDLCGGVIWDGIHELDYVIWLLGDVVNYTSTFENMNVLDIETEEIAEITLQHENRAISSIHLDYIQPLKRRGFELVGSNGTYLWSSTGKNPEHMKLQTLKGMSDIDVLYDDKYSDANTPYVEEIRDIFSVLDGKEVKDTSLLSIHDACKEIRIIEDIKSKKGKM